MTIDKVAVGSVLEHRLGLEGSSTGSVQALLKQEIVVTLVENICFRHF